MYLSRVFNLMLIFFLCERLSPPHHIKHFEWREARMIQQQKKRCWDGERVPLDMGKGKNHLSSFGGWRTNNFHLCSLFYSFSSIGTGVCVCCVAGRNNAKKHNMEILQISLQNKAAFKLERIWRNQEELSTAVEFYAHTIFIKKYTVTMTTSKKNQ